MNDFIEFWNDPLRLILAVAGAVVILAIIIFGRRSGSQKDLKTLDLSEPHSPHSTVRWEIHEDIVDSDPQVGGLTASEIQSALESGPVKDVGPVSVSKAADRMRSQASASHMADHNRASHQQHEYVRSTQPLVADPVTMRDERALHGIKTPVANLSLEPTSDFDAEPHGEGEMFIVLHVMAKDERMFHGSDLQKAVEIAGMGYGEHRIFHFPGDRLPGEMPYFSLVNMMEPGIFDIEAMDGFETTGVSLFMRLPGPADGLRAFSNMLVTAQALAKRLEGQLFDERHQPLSQAMITKLRAEVAAFDMAIANQKVIDLAH